MTGELAFFPSEGPWNFLTLNRFIVLISACKNSWVPYKSVESVPDCLVREGEGRRRAEEGRDRTGTIERAASLLRL